MCKGWRGGAYRAAPALCERGGEGTCTLITTGAAVEALLVPVGAVGGDDVDGAEAVLTPALQHNIAQTWEWAR